MYGRSFAECEYAWSSLDDSARIFKRSPNQKDRIHPTQKPVALYAWCIAKTGLGGGKVLDTHLGSQSSRIAAFTMGFDFTGFELDKDYFDAGCKRFELAIQQQSLFNQ